MSRLRRRENCRPGTDVLTVKDTASGLGSMFCTTGEHYRKAKEGFRAVDPRRSDHFREHRKGSCLNGPGKLHFAAMGSADPKGSRLPVCRFVEGRKKKGRQIAANGKHRFAFYRRGGFSEVLLSEGAP